MDMAPGRRWRYVLPELVAVIALQLAGAGAGVAAALAAGRAGPARAAGGAVAGVAGQQQAGVRWLVLAGAVVLVLAVLVAARRGDQVRIEEVTAADPDSEAAADGSLLPGPHAKLAGPTFEEWLTTQLGSASAA